LYATSLARSSNGIFDEVAKRLTLGKHLFELSSQFRLNTNLRDD
jgi:hypothetical protein